MRDRETKRLTSGLKDVFLPHWSYEFHRAFSKEQRAQGKGQRAESKEQGAKGGGNAKRE
jgi:hypothetical protein